MFKFKEHDRIINKRNFKTKCNGKKNRWNPETDLKEKIKKKTTVAWRLRRRQRRWLKRTLNLKHVHYYCNANAVSLQVVLRSIFHCRRKTKIRTIKYEKYFLLLLLPLQSLGILQWCALYIVYARFYPLPGASIVKIIEHAIRNSQLTTSNCNTIHIKHVIKCARMVINRFDSTLNSIVYRISNEVIIIAHCTQECARKLEIRKILSKRRSQVPSIIMETQESWSNWRNNNN